MSTEARQGRSPAPADLALVGGLLAYGLAEALVVGAGEPQLAGRLAAATAMVLPLLWRRVFPLLALPVVVTVIVAGTLAGVVPTDAILPLPAFVLAFFSAAAHSSHMAAAAAAAAGSLALAWLGLAISDTPDSPAAYLGVSFMAGVSFALGRVVNHRTSESQRLSRLSAELDREREVHTRAAVAEERARIGRELHDVVAHSISLIAVQSGAAAATARDDPERAAGSMESVGTVARDALGEMRRLVGMLRAEDGPAGLAPQPGLGDVEELVRQAEAAGQRVELKFEGDERSVPPGVDLSAYRIVQEAMTNARKHGEGGAVVVTVAYRPQAVAIEVVNSASEAAELTHGTGHGLIGMRERVRIYGGRFNAGREPGGRYRVTATLPTGDDES